MEISPDNGEWNTRQRLRGAEAQAKAFGSTGFNSGGQQAAGIFHRSFAVPVSCRGIMFRPKAAARQERNKAWPEAPPGGPGFASIKSPLPQVARRIVGAGLMGDMKKRTFLIAMARNPVRGEKDEPIPKSYYRRPY